MYKSRDITAGKFSAGGFFIPFLSVLTTAAFILRLIAAWEMSSAGNGFNNVFTPFDTSDLATYMKLGRECAAGNFPETFYYQPYYYAVFLPLCNMIFGKFAVWGVIFVQALLSGATVFLGGLCGRKIFSPAAGLWTAFWICCSSSLILYVPFHQNETLQSFHLILLFFLTLKALEKESLWFWILVGTVAGIAVLTRGNIYLLLPVIIFAMVKNALNRKIPAKKSLIKIALFIAAVLIVQLPFALKNSIAEKRLCGASTASDAVLALGNSPEAPAGGRDPGLPAGAMYYPEAYRRMMNNTKGYFGRSVPEQMWQWFTEDPAAFLELQLRKALLFWDGREIPNNVSLDYDGIRHSKVLRWLFIGRNQVFLTMALAGMFWFIPVIRKSRKKLYLLYGFVLSFYVAVIVFYILSRFKAPVLPLLAIFCGGVSAEWCFWVKRAFRKKVLHILLTLLLGYLFVNGMYDIYRDMEPGINRVLYPEGMVLDMNGPDIHHFDYGPMPFGAWKSIELRPGMVLEKQFYNLGDQPADICLMLSSFGASGIKMLVNNRSVSFDFPELLPGKSDRKMVRFPAFIYQGRVQIVIEEVYGEKIYALCDFQRNWFRSSLNGEVLSGEWVMRACVPRW